MTSSPAEKPSASFFGHVLTLRQKLTPRWVVVGVAIPALAVLSAGAATSRDAAPKEPASNDRPISVGVAPAEPVDSFLRKRVYTGTLVAKRRSVLSFELAGKLLELSVDEGDRVAKNQPLARLDTRRLEAGLLQAKSELAQSRAVLKELEAGPRQQTIAAARAEVSNLAAQRDVAGLRLRRRERLVQTTAISQEEYDEAVYTHRATVARTEVAQKTLDELEAGTRVEQIEAQRALVAAIEARLADIHHQLDDAVMLAPYAGRIVRRRIDEGTIVAAGAPVFEQIEDASLEAWIGVPPRSAKALRVGGALEVTIDGRTVQATVQSVRAELDPETRTQNVVLRLEDPKGLVAGQVARVAVREPVAMTGYWTPTATLTPDRRGLWSVLVVDEKGVVAGRPVEVIENDGDRTFVRGTLQAGERVIVEGAHRVVPGQRVRAVDRLVVANSEATP
ncbi:Multidrug export protein AcrE precursor [Planctomycetes bacterium MalM25]|nr:Multidrug export protein AcrE precursor [Planctomycetes bacterium MalM25]